VVFLNFEKRTKTPGKKTAHKQNKEKHLPTSFSGYLPNIRRFQNKSPFALWLAPRLEFGNGVGVVGLALGAWLSALCSLLSSDGQRKLCVLKLLIRWLCFFLPGRFAPQRAPLPAGLCFQPQFLCVLGFEWGVSARS
jgi:hypothetical protein